MIEREYDPALLAFVIDTSADLSIIKEQLILVAKRIESDEKAYIYHSHYNHIPRWPGEVVGAIANYQPESLHIHKALNKIIELWSFEYADASRYIFVIADSLDEITVRRVKNIARKEKKAAWQQKPIKFFFLLLSEVSEAEDEDDLSFIYVNGPGSLGSVIARNYKGVETPFLIKGHEPLDIEALKRDYKENYGKEKAKSEDGETD